MKEKEMIDNYLISKGCSISNKYAYIIDDDYDYLKKEKDETLNIINMKILLSTKIKNTMMLSYVASNARYGYAKYINSIISGKGAELSQNDIFEICNHMVDASLVYFTDFIKYFGRKLELDEKVLSNIMNLSDSSIVNLNNSVVNLYQKHQLNINNINADIMSDRQSRDAKTISEAANASRYGYGKIDYYPSLTGYGGRAFASEVSVSSVSQSDLNASFSANAFCSTIMGDIHKESANAKTIKELSDIVDNFISKFNNDLQEIFVIKMENLFNEDVFNNSKDIEKNPLNFNVWKEKLTEIHENDYKSIQKMDQYYDFNFIRIVDENLTNNIYDYYIKEQKCDYKGGLLDLYLFLLNKEKFDTTNALSSKITSYYTSMINKANFFRKNKALNFYEEKRKIINECSYLTEKDKKQLDTVCNTGEKADLNFCEKNRKSFVSELIALIIFIVILITIIVFWKHIPGLLKVLLIGGYIFCFYWFAVMGISDMINYIKKK